VAINLQKAGDLLCIGAQGTQPVRAQSGTTSDIRCLEKINANTNTLTSLGARSAKRRVAADELGRVLRNGFPLQVRDCRRLVWNKSELFNRRVRFIEKYTKGQHNPPEFAQVPKPRKTEARSRSSGGAFRVSDCPKQFGRLALAKL